MYYNIENIYYGNQIRNHKVPKVYYKQWIKNNKNRLTIFDKIKNKNFTISLDNFTVENYAFVIKFGDIFLPNIAINHFSRITNKYDFTINGKIETDIQKLSLAYSDINSAELVISKNGIESRQQFNNEIINEKCRCIENGLNLFYENEFSKIINSIKNMCNNNSTNSELVDNILFDLKELYLSFYLRSDASKRLFENLFENYVTNVFRFNSNYNPNSLDLKNELFNNLKRMYLWYKMFEPKQFDNIFKAVNEKINNLYPCIHINNSKYKFYTSELPIINNGNSTFMILTPELLLEYVPNYDLELKNHKAVLVDNNLSEDIVVMINNDIKNNSNLIVL